MKILFVTYDFAPYNCIGAVRTTNTASALVGMGHEVKVLSASDQPYEPSLPLPGSLIGQEIVRTRWKGLDDVFVSLAHRATKTSSTGMESFEGAGQGRVKRMLKRVYMSLIRIPDRFGGWRAPALKAGETMLQEWSPDVIYASSPTPVAFSVASKLSKKFQIPWVAEFRDLWGRHPSRNIFKIRRYFDCLWERQVLRSVSGLVTVSNDLKATLDRCYPNIPTQLIYNSYNDELLVPAAAVEDGILDKALFNIVYTGRVYWGNQDFSAFFNALIKVREEGYDPRLTVCGTNHTQTIRLAENVGLSECVRNLGKVDYATSRQLQKEADCLLILQWNDPAQKGILTGKFFEYLQTGKPILATGYSNNELGEIITTRQLGHSSDDDSAIADWLIDKINEKSKNGGVDAVPHPGCREFSCKEQTRRLGLFLEEII